MKTDLRSVYSAETFKIHTAKSIADYAKVYGTTPNAILGFEDPAPQPPIGNMQFPEWIPADQIGDLPDGYYHIAYRDNVKIKGEAGKEWINERIAYRQDGKWYSLTGKMHLRFTEIKIIAVAPACASAPAGFTFFLGGAFDDGV